MTKHLHGFGVTRTGYLYYFIQKLLDACIKPIEGVLSSLECLEELTEAIA